MSGESFNTGAAAQGGSQGGSAASVAGDWLLKYPALMDENARQQGIAANNNSLAQQLGRYRGERLNRRQAAQWRASGDLSRSGTAYQEGLVQANQDRGEAQGLRNSGQSVALSKLNPSVGGQTAWGANAAATLHAPRMLAYRTQLQRQAGDQGYQASVGRAGGQLQLTGAGIDRSLHNDSMRNTALDAYGNAAGAEFTEQDNGPGAGYYDRMLGAAGLGLVGSAAGYAAGGMSGGKSAAAAGGGAGASRAAAAPTGVGGGRSVAAPTSAGAAPADYRRPVGGAGFGTRPMDKYGDSRIAAPVNPYSAQA